MNPVIYIFVNKSLNMSSGKVAAQVAHAMAITMIDESEVARKQWKEAMHKTVLIMEGKDEDHLRNIERYLNERKIPTRIVVDEGVNEIDPHTITALSTCVLDKDAEDTVKALSTFKLYHDKVRLTLEIDK